MIERALDAIARTLLVGAAVLGFALSFLVVADVIGRGVFNSPVKGTPELVSISIVIICFLQAAYAIRSGSMLNVDFITTHFPLRLQSILAMAGAIVGVLFFGLVCWGSIEPLGHAWTSDEYEGEGALRVPSWPAKLVIVVGTALASISYVLLAIKNFNSALAGEGPAGAVSSSH